MTSRKIAFLCLLFPLWVGWGRQEPLVKVGLCLDHERGPWVAFLEKAMTENRVDFLIENAKGNPQTQAHQAEDLLKEGVQALVVIPCDAAKAAPLSEAAHQAGVPILSLERPFPGADYLIAFNAVKRAELETQALVAKRPKGNYVLLKNVSEDGSSQEVQEGWMKVLEPLLQKGDIRIVASLRTQSGNSQELKSLLTGVKRVDAVLASNAEAAEMATFALDKTGFTGKILVAGLGVDLPTCRRIGSGSQSLTLYDPPKKLAEETAYLAAKLARKAKEFDCQFVQVNNGAEKIPAVLLTPMVVEAQNMESTVIQDKIWNKTEVYGK